MPANDKSANLIITRPAPFAQQLEQSIRADSACMAHNINIITQPLIGFTANETLSHRTLSTALETSDIAIFISQQAVDFTLSNFPSGAPMPSLVIAVGQSTQARLADYGIKAHRPQTSNSEGMIALLQQAPFDSARSVALIRGNKGRELLETFLERHFRPTIVEVYHRQPITNQKLPHGFDSNLPTAMIATSGQLLTLGVDLLKSANLATKNCSIICGSDRISHMAQQLAFEHCYTARSATNQELMVTCREWLTTQP